MNSFTHTCTIQYSSWATEAFFKYGGEPHFIFPTTVGPATQQDGAPSVHSAPTFLPVDQRQVPSMAQLPQTLTPQYGARTTPVMHQTPTLGGAMGGALGGALIGPEVKMSGKHNGLYRYLARLLRPVWNEPIVICITELNTDKVSLAFSIVPFSCRIDNYFQSGRTVVHITISVHLQECFFVYIP